MLNCTREQIDNFPDYTAHSSPAGLTVRNSERITIEVESSDTTGNIPVDPIASQSIPIMCAASTSAGLDAFSDSVGVQIQILEETKLDESFHSDNPAVFEVQPKEENIDLNLYYETSDTVMIPKVGMKIYSSNVNFNTTTITAVSNNGRQITIAAQTDNVLIPQGTELTIENNHLLVDNANQTRNQKQTLKAATDIVGNSTVINVEKDNIRWYNCIAFGNGVDEDKIFVGRLRKEFKNINFYNTAVPGYNLKHFKYNLKEIDNFKNINKIFYFITFNDVYGGKSIVQLNKNDSIKKNLYQK